MATNNSQSGKNEHQIDVVDHPQVYMWMKDTARKDPEGFLRLVGPNEKEFTILFGAPQWQNNGSKGWTHGWSVHESNLNWLILTGPQGTYFRLRLPVSGETYLNDPKIGVGVTQYLNYLLKKISH